jgi:preprotein translocase subunit SecF
MIFSLTFSIQDTSMFLTFQFCRDWEFRAMKTQALGSGLECISSLLNNLPLTYIPGLLAGKYSSLLYNLPYYTFLGSWLHGMYSSLLNNLSLSHILGLLAGNYSSLLIIYHFHTSLGSWQVYAFIPAP